MKKEDYLKSIVIRNKLVNIGEDDCGQCYYFEFVNDKGEIEEIGCGTYNFNYYEAILSVLDPKGYIISVFGEDYYEETLKQREERGFDNSLYDYEDYAIYDIEKYYKEEFKESQT